MTEKLKPCPFCGGEAVLECRDEDYNDDWIVFCRNLDGECEICPCTKYHETAEDAISAWNRRADNCENHDEAVSIYFEGNHMNVAGLWV